MPKRTNFRAPEDRYRRPKLPIVIPDRVAERAATRYTVDDATGCHISTYSVASHGYAQIGWYDGERTQMVTAHRAAWVYANGRQIPGGMTVDHMCKTRRCVNPLHLRVMSNFENARRTDGRDWPIGRCANGHTNADLAFEPSGKIRCGACYPTGNLTPVHPIADTKTKAA